LFVLNGFQKNKFGFVGMNEMKMMLLEDCCEILDSMRVPITASDREEGPYPYYGANGIQDHVANYIFDDELVLLAEDGGNFGSKTRPIAYRVSGKCWVNNHAHVLKPKAGLDVDFLCYSLMFYNTDGLVNGATRQKLTQATMRKMMIPDLSMDKQLSIVDQLNRVVAIRDLRQHELQKLDELIKARFVELFGEPSDNPNGWPVVNITEVIDGKVSNGFFAKRDDYGDNGNIQVLGVVNVVNRMYSGIEDLPKTNGTSADIAKYGVKYGDMLFCRSSLVAEGIGKASIVPENIDDNILFECHVIRLPLDLEKCVPEFMQVLSTTDYFRRQIIAQSKTATMTTIGQDGILKSSIILPPIEKQKEFYRFVKQVDKSKFMHYLNTAFDFQLM
ncbi:MAG: restriction endonuclease subunit S, partial [Spirochaetia bacterium]|nr:restriction endonuclease subunit S [Spirochaetia bacterium]